MTKSRAIASLYGRVLERAARLSPGRVASAIDRLRPGLQEGFGGPFNGQQRRIEAVAEIFQHVRFGSVIETGTYRGTTTLHLNRLAAAPTATIEASSRYFHYAQRRLRRVPGIDLIRGDSATVLRALAGKAPWDREPTFFYLDAHWLDALPLQGELDAITQGWRDFAILIDDFSVPDDSGYAFDDYGPGKSLDVTILAQIAQRPVIVYWPAARATTETGACRGWVVLASEGQVDDALRSVGRLRRDGTAAEVLAPHRPSSGHP